jgi:hypothetical protein
VTAQGWPDFTEQTQLYPGVDLLIRDVAGLLAPDLAYALNQPRPYAGAFITLAPALAADITVEHQLNAVSGLQWTQQKHAPGGGVPIGFYTPFPIPAQQTATVKITSSVNQVSQSDIFIYGLGIPAPSAQGARLIRSDYRDYPIGALGAALTTVAGGGGSIIPAPAAPRRIMLATLTGFSTGGNLVVQATVGGTVISLMQSTAMLPQANPVPATGVLLDHGTSLDFLAQAGSSQEASVTYDIVI